ncbi:MAG: V4R domain-containing protein [Verrucomicrobiota bacterium]|nr:V4R domain-containing protein [Verrucomicrobiota bacterium]
MSKISPADGGHRSTHNYYTPEDYFSRDENHGLKLRDGQRGVFATEDFVVGLHQGLDEEVGEAGSLIMYKCGYEWGVQDMKRFAERMRHEFGGGKLDIWQMNPKFVFETWWWPLTIQGWGSWTIDTSFQKQGMLFLTIHNSAVAQSLEQVGKPVCHMYAGMFAGVFSVFDRQQRNAIEIQCYSMGNDCCKFLIGDEKRVNSAEFWRREGANAGEIKDKLLT